MRQVYPVQAELGDADLAARYAYPERAAQPGSTGVGGAVVRANMVTSLDGAATLRGRSGGLSGRADRRVFALLRALADVVLVGAGTVRTERYGPTRPGQAAGWGWLRAGRPPSAPIAVVTRQLDLDLSSPLFAASGGHARTIVITTAAAPAERRAAAARVAEIIVAGARDVDLRAAVAALAGLGHQRVLTEGGPRLLSQIVAADLLDELCLTVSPLVTGSAAGRILAEPTAGAPFGGEQSRPFRLEHVLVDEDHLLCRYLAAPVSPAGS